MRTDIRSIDADITASLAVIRSALAPADGTAIDDALTTVETFAAVALRVMAKANPSRVRSEARNVEIQNRMPRGAA